MVNFADTEVNIYPNSSIGQLTPLSNMEILSTKTSPRIEDLRKHVVINSPLLTEDEILQLMNLIEEFNDIFALNDYELEECKAVEHKIKDRKSTL